MKALKKLRTERVGKQHRTIWLFMCDCGNEFEARIDKFKEGRIKSCGCIRGK